MKFSKEGQKEEALKIQLFQHPAKITFHYFKKLN
jgi:hypothetical protein